MTPQGPLGAKMTEEMAKSRSPSTGSGVWGVWEGVWEGSQGGPRGWFFSQTGVPVQDLGSDPRIHPDSPL